jgi:hypothetical protein
MLSALEFAGHYVQLINALDWLSCFFRARL